MKRADSFLKFGVFRHFSRGGVLADADCVYVGHLGIAHDALIQHICGAIVRKLCSMCGFEYRCETEQLGFAGTIDYNIKSESTNAVTGRTVVSGVGTDTLLDFSTALAADITTYFRTITIARDATLDTFVMRVNTADASTNVKAARLYANTSMVHYRYFSRLAVQNRTIASSAVGADEGNRNDVANNPLVGKMYSGRGTGMLFPVTTGTAPQATLLSNGDAGLISMLPNGPGTSLGDLERYRRPPTAKPLIHCTRTKGVFLNPGNIKSSIIKNTFHISMSKLLSLLSTSLSYPISDKMYFPMGSCNVLALQKRCDTRVDEPTISVGWELENNYACYISMVKPSILPSNDVV